MTAGAAARNLDGSWKVRRALIFTTLIFCAAVVVRVMWTGEDTRVNETLVLSAFGLAGMVIGSYVFGAVWDDRTKRRPDDDYRGPSMGPGSQM